MVQVVFLHMYLTGCKIPRYNIILIQMRSIGIITIHKIYNYGSVLQAYALQFICEKLGYKTEIIDYKFPNEYHLNNRFTTPDNNRKSEPWLLKLLFAFSLVRQHKGIRNFVNKYMKLSRVSYESPEALVDNVPVYDIYITGSDQLWNPKHTNADPSFMLHFAPDKALKISYAASIASEIPVELQSEYSRYLGRYSHISMREQAGIDVVNKLSGKEAVTVLDPTLLLDAKEWNKLATSSKSRKRKYILCYFLNYSFDAFPYVDDFAEYVQKQTGYDIISIARPPHKFRSLKHAEYRVGASPEEFLSLIRDAEIILTTSFHGTAFALNFEKPLFTIVKSVNESDSRQLNLMRSVGLENLVVSKDSNYPDINTAYYDKSRMRSLLQNLRDDSLDFLKKSLKDA